MGEQVARDIAQHYTGTRFPTYDAYSKGQQDRLVEEALQRVTGLPGGRYVVATVIVEIDPAYPSKSWHPPIDRVVVNGIDDGLHYKDGVLQVVDVQVSAPIDLGVPPPSAAPPAEVQP